MAKTRLASKTVQWGRFKLTEAEIERQIGEATRRGEEELRTQPLAVAVRFDKRIRRVIVDLNKGTTLSVPVELLQGVHDASLKDLSRVEIMSPGMDIEWPTLDQQFSIEGLMAGRFGNKAWMASLEQRGALTKHKLKAKTSRTTGRKVRRLPKTTAAATV